MMLFYFFTHNPCVIETIRRLKSHTENILSRIRSDIEFSGKRISIDKSDDIKKLQESSNQIVIISGQGGVGKTAIIKQLYNIDKNKPYFLFKATEFDIKELDDIFHEANAQHFFDILRHDQDKTFIIDSAEKLLDLKTQTQ
jgi:replication-associated recombination protein RarA